MSYSRQKVVEAFFEGYPAPIRRTYGIRLYNCQKKVQKHYVTALDLDSRVYYTTNWDSRSRVSAPSDPVPVYEPDDPIGVDSLAGVDQDTIYSADLDRARNKAYAKFTDQMKDSAQNANNALECGQSLGQILGHVRSIAGAVSALKHGDVSGAAKKLGVSISGNRERKIKQRAKQLSDRWLELHFGWVPLVQDIGSSIDILQGTGKSSVSFQRISSGASFSGSHSSTVSQLVPGPYFDSTSDSYRWSGGCRMRGVVAVENPNIAIANQMGFVNPLSVAWEAVPFSFVVDWFSNVGQCLGAMSDFWGYQLHNASTSTLAFNNLTHSYSRQSVGINSQLVKSTVYSVKLVHQGRLGGLVSPVFRFTPFKGFSLARGATAISLLVQQMKH
jgi:hypothetical protein